MPVVRPKDFCGKGFLGIEESQRNDSDVSKIRLGSKVAPAPPPMTTASPKANLLMTWELLVATLDRKMLTEFHFSDAAGIISLAEKADTVIKCLRVFGLRGSARASTIPKHGR